MKEKDFGLRPEHYICEKCLKLKTMSRDGFGIVWSKNKKDAYLCKDCANGVLVKTEE